MNYKKGDKITWNKKQFKCFICDDIIACFGLITMHDGGAVSISYTDIIVGSQISGRSIDEGVFLTMEGEFGNGSKLGTLGEVLG